MKNLILLLLILLCALGTAASAAETATAEDAESAASESLTAEELDADISDTPVEWNVEHLLRLVRKQAETIATLEGRLSTLEGSSKKVSEKVDSVPSWVPKVKVSGDMRYRYESINTTGKKDRERDRIRLRLGIDAQVNDQLDLKTRLATGTGDPISTNQTIGEGFSSKSFRLDRAFFDWHPNENVNFYGGKMANPFFTPGGSQILWDGDLNPEGLAVKFKGSGKSASPFLTLANYWVNEKSSDGDTRMFGGQGGVTITGGKKSKVTFGLGYYAYSDLKGLPPLVDPKNSFGNAVTKDADDNLFYADDYKMFEAFAEIGLNLDKVPFTIYGDYVTNTGASTDDTAWLAGLSIGKNADPGDWQFTYNYRRVEANAVLGAFCDSDFIGGGTNGKGHAFGTSVLLRKNATAALTYLVNDIGLAGGKDYNRLQLDVLFKF